MNQVHRISDRKPVGYYDGARLEMMAFVPAEARRILEVGCGSGAFGGALKAERGVEVWGIELMKEPAEKARQRLDKVIVGNIETMDVDLPEGYFDCVVCNDVLEHLSDPWSVLKTLQKALSEKGGVVASIPNIRHFPTFRRLFLNKEWTYVDAGILDRTHLRFFTQKTIEDMFHECGFRVEQIKGIYPMEFPWKFGLFNWLMGNRFDDMRYKEFACFARNSVVAK